MIRTYRERSAIYDAQGIAMVEGYTDPKSPDPRNRPLSTPRWQKVALGACLLGAFAPLGAPTMEAFAASDRQEQTIENGVRATLGRDALGLADVKVTCIDDPLMVVVGLIGEKRGAAQQYTGRIWLEQSACDGAEAFAADPITEGELAGEPLSGDVQAKIQGLRVAAHEASHGVLDTFNEAAAECHALQLAPSMAEVLGMEPALKPQFQKRLLEIMSDEYEQGGDAAKDYRFDPEDCRPGGNGDLSTKGLGTQVYFPVE